MSKREFPNLQARLQIKTERLPFETGKAKCSPVAAIIRLKRRRKDRIYSGASAPIARGASRECPGGAPAISRRGRSTRAYFYLTLFGRREHPRGKPTGQPMEKPRDGLATKNDHQQNQCLTWIVGRFCFPRAPFAGTKDDEPKADARFLNPICLAASQNLGGANAPDRRFLQAYGDGP
jgi:hypothetical protein